MALSDAILDIAKQMEEDIQNSSEAVQWQVTAYIRQLRSAVKAAEGQNQGIPIIIPNQVNPQEVLLKHAQREMEQRTILQERAGTSMVQIIGGSSDGDLTPIDPNMPINARMPIGSEVYIFREGKLHFSEEETQKYRNRKM